MKILIAGIPKNTTNYEKALSLCHVTHDTALCPSDLSSYDRLLLPGGGDLHPSWFGQVNQGSEDIDRELDRAQFALLHAFFLAGKPVLGICRGMQLINVYFGGDLIQDLPTAETHRYCRHDQTHSAVCLPDSLLFRLYGNKNSCLVNSAHHQGCGKIGRDLIITQKASDQVTEAIEHKTRPVLGVQWHPERTGLFSHQPDIINGSRLIHCFAERM